MEGGVDQHKNLTTTNTTNSTNTTTECWNEYCWDEDTYYDAIYTHIAPKDYEWFFIILYIVTFIVGLVGNTLVCFAVWRNEAMRTITNVFIVNLAVGDFLVILICLPPTLIQDVTETWFLGTAVCKAVLFLQSTSVTVSVLTLSAIAVERWWAICYPLRFKSTLPRARKIILIIWIVAFLASLPELIVAHAFPFQFPAPISSSLFTHCKPAWDNLNQGVYQIFVVVFFYLLPIVLMTLTYTHIATVLWSREIPGDVVGSKKSGRKPMLDSNRKSQEEQIMARRKAAKMLIAIVVMFALCYLPVHLMSLLRYFNVVYSGNKSDAQIADSLIAQSLVNHWLPYFNSALNPVIYNFMSAKFRKEFKAACYCCFSKLGRRPLNVRRDHTFTMTFSNSNYSNCHTEEVTMASI
ncbi:orexin receptor type 2-like [Physella acuta]|uniref:orexin receptor type 2-like n=1 Tax=Physella acuta TaxID=109671 RepID=UPI0027DB5A28|nr:orexin receptor type 2-like [Physella acuta]